MDCPKLTTLKFEMLEPEQKMERDIIKDHTATVFWPALEMQNGGVWGYAPGVLLLELCECCVLSCR